VCVCVCAKHVLDYTALKSFLQHFDCVLEGSLFTACTLLGEVLSSGISSYSNGQLTPGH